MKPCEWCGAEHPVEKLCEGRPKWSRRGFISMFGAGVVGLVTGGLPVPIEPNPWKDVQDFTLAFSPDGGSWLRFIGDSQYALAVGGLDLAKKINDPSLDWFEITSGKGV